MCGCAYEWAKRWRLKCTANNGPMKIEYRNETVWASLFPKQNYNVLSPNFHIHVSVCERNTFPGSVCLISLQPNQTDLGNK
jgi:hypothetical protein